MLSVFFILLASRSPAQEPSKGAPPPDKNFFIQFYQDHISVADGDRCTMYPSCSEYAAQAFKRHGPIMGWIMSCDRLVRCGRNEVDISPSRYFNGRAHTVDPVEANDFWWFNKPENDMGAFK